LCDNSAVFGAVRFAIWSQHVFLSLANSKGKFSAVLAVTFLSGFVYFLSTLNCIDPEG